MESREIVKSNNESLFFKEIEKHAILTNIQSIFLSNGNMNFYVSSCKFKKTIIFPRYSYPRHFSSQGKSHLGKNVIFSKFMKKLII